MPFLMILYAIIIIACIFNSAFIDLVNCSHIFLRKLILPNDHKQNRLAWTVKYLHVAENDFRNVIWMDEYTAQLETHRN